MQFKNVLIVEDNNKLAKLYQKVLNHSGYQTRTEDTAAGAIEALIEFDPGTVFLDWQLSDGTAEPFLEYVQSMPRESVPKIIIISAEIGYDELGDYTNIVEKHYPKPVSIHDMVRNVDDAP